jgi:hypothetical protein
MAETFRRPAHNLVLAALRQLDAQFLRRHHICFGGGTRIVLELGEYRESADIDFLCASREGYRALRETVSETSLGDLARPGLRLAREVRADQYGIRTWLSLGEAKLKFEVILEARIALDAADVASIPVPCLDRRHAFAEKLLANADRGLDPSTFSRDVLDLAFMAQAWSLEDAQAGAEMARAAYGADIDRKLAAVVAKLRDDRKYRDQCVRETALDDTRTLAKGLAALARFTDSASSPRS